MKKIILIVILLVVLGGMALLSYSSLLKIPIFSNIFYREKVVELGIQSNPEAAKSFTQKLGFLTIGPSVPLMIPVPPEPRTLEFSDIEFTSWVNEMCIEYPEKCPFKNFQVKFEEGKFRGSAHLLIPVEYDLTLLGKVIKKDEKSIDLELEKVWVGNLPVPDNIEKKIEEMAENKINETLKEIEYLRIDEIQFFEGRVVFKGILSSGLEAETPEFWVVECERNEDCGKTTCQQGRDKCVEIRHFCKNRRCSSEIVEFPEYICQRDGQCEDTCGNGICDSEYEKLHCPQDCF